MFKNRVKNEPVSAIVSRNPIDELRSCVGSWERLQSEKSGKDMEEIPIMYLYYYYPACLKDRTEDEFHIRNYIYDFREGCSGSAPNVDAAQNLVRHEIAALLQKTFGERLKSITFICMPCSSAEHHETRFRWFSERVCKDTGMVNGFEHISVIGETKPSHLGGTESEKVAYDKDWFKGRVVLLFDDILNKGKHIRRYKSELEAQGATVIGALFLAKVTSVHEKEQPAGLILRVPRDRL